MLVLAFNIVATVALASVALLITGGFLALIGAIIHDLWIKS